MQPAAIVTSYTPPSLTNTLFYPLDTSQNVDWRQRLASRHPPVPMASLAADPAKSVTSDTDIQEAPRLLNTNAPMKSMKSSIIIHDQHFPLRSMPSYPHGTPSLAKRRKKRPQSLAIVPDPTSRPIAPRRSPPNEVSGSVCNAHCKRLEVRSDEQTPDTDILGFQVDAFEILRAKITGITRAMQEFQVHELVHEEPQQKRHHHRYYTEPGRSALSPTLFSQPALGYQDEESSQTRHHMNSHYGSIPVTPFSENSSSVPSEETSAPTPGTWDTTVEDPWAHLHTNEDFERDMANHDRRLSNPRIAALFSTTNSLIQSRLCEEASSVTLDEVVTPMAAHWRSQFLNLASACIQHSERLESLSTELLGTEGRVRELLSLETDVNEQFEEREKAYEDRIREYEGVATQQKIMIESLEELMADLEMKIRHMKRRQTPSGGASRTNSGHAKHTVNEMLAVEEKNDLIHRLRWDIGMLIGGGVGTGHVIHSFEGRLNGIEMIIAGSGTTVENEETDQVTIGLSAGQESLTFMVVQKPYFVSRTLQQAKYHHHRFALHIHPQDRKTRFILLSKSLWAPDGLVDQCQYENPASARQCTVRFTFFQRRHHCRRCGQIICQRHSTNRLPLFPPTATHHQIHTKWHRVCDRCFLDLITPLEEAEHITPLRLTTL